MPEPSQKTIKLLICKGADVNLENNFCESPFHTLMDSENIICSKDEEARYQCILIILKEYSKLKLEILSVSKRDLDFIENNAVLKGILKSY